MVVGTLQGSFIILLARRRPQAQSGAVLATCRFAANARSEISLGAGMA